MDKHSRSARTSGFGLSNRLELGHENQRDPTYFPNTTNTSSTRSNSSSSYGLTGTYRLDPSRSEDAGEIAEKAIRNDNVQNNRDAQSDLEDKLQAPEQLMIEVRGSQVTLGSSKAPQITLRRTVATARKIWRTVKRCASAQRFAGRN
jgi:hypothetical protein